MPRHCRSSATSATKATAVPPCGDHPRGFFGRLAHDIDDKDTRAGTGKEDRRGTPVADALVGCPAAGNDRYFSGEPRIILRSRSFAHDRPLLAAAAAP